jgi:hypothetical protein
MDRAQFAARSFFYFPTYALANPGSNMPFFSTNYYEAFSIYPFERCMLLKQLWSTTNISERDRVGFLIGAMGYDNNLTVSEFSSVILRQVRSDPQDFMNLGDYEIWFHNNTNYFSHQEDYAQWVKTNQFIRR